MSTSVQNYPATHSRPRWVEGVVDYLRAIPSRITNQPSPGIRIPQVSALRHVFWAAFLFFAGSAGGWVAVERQEWLLLPIFWGMLVHGARKLQLNIGHACAHATVTKNKKVDRLMGAASHLLVVASEFEAYSGQHVVIHHDWQIVATELDPTLKTLGRAGIGPGIPKQRLYRNLMVSIFSPVYHAYALGDRLKSHLGAPSRRYRLIFIAFWVTLFAAVLATGTWFFFTIAVLLPLIWGYQTSQLLRLCVEHRLPVNPKGKPRPSEEMQDLTDGIVLRLTSPVDMLVRVLVLTCDSVSHDFHHYQSKSREWANYTAARAHAKADALSKGRNSQYHEFVGYLRALDACFEAMSKSPRGAR